MASSSGSAATDPLNVGNVVTIAFQLYRSNLKTFLQIALFGFLWAIIPVFGWAKFYANSGLISRLSFGQLTNQPESVATAREQVQSKRWAFLGIAILVGLLTIVAYFGLIIVGAIPFGILIFAGSALGSVVGGVVAVLGGILFLVVILGGLTWLYAHWLVAEVALAMEDNNNSSKNISRSWELTHPVIWRVQGILLVAFLVTLPILGVTSYIPQFVLLTLDQGSALWWIVYSISLVTSFSGGIITLPFWQALKAVLYYDLRNRREGLGLHLRQS